MSLLQAYLQSSKTRQILSRKPGQKGFSLIELVVVIGVLAVLTAVALPGFLGVADDAAVSAAKKGLTDFYNECFVLKNRGNFSNDDDTNPSLPKLQDFEIGATAATESAFDLELRAEADRAKCFAADNEGNLSNLASVPETEEKFPVFFINGNTGKRTCTTGNAADTGFEKTFKLGCDIPDDATTDNRQTGTW